VHAIIEFVNCFVLVIVTSICWFLVTETFVATIDKPIALINIGSLWFITQNYSSWYIRDVQQQLVRI
jgi:hypothetical protein